jgi:hypothetical protein
MRLSIAPARNKKLAYTLYSLSLGLLAGTLVLAASVSSAQALSPGSDWGSDGAMAATNSAVTVAWDNSGGTPADDKVARDSSQVLPHTGGKTYSDVPSAISDPIAQGFGGMTLSVSQTTGLVHQAVSVAVTGVAAGSADNPRQLAVMQCWGSTTAAQPDPEDCQWDGNTVDGPAVGARGLPSSDAPLLGGGDLKANTLVGQFVIKVSGGTATLAGIVDAQSSTATLPADGAAGKVEFLDNATGAVVAEAPVQGGLATSTVTGLQDGQKYTYIAKYVADPSENYLSSVNVLPTSVTLDAEGNANATTPLPTAPSSGLGTNSAPDNTASAMPFHAIDGTFTGDTAAYFTNSTTNAFGSMLTPSVASLTVTRSFEVQTGAEAPGLGCGARSDQPSTSVCWLVAIPIDQTVNPISSSGGGPLALSDWAQRVQVKLTFAAVSASCGTGARELASGSDLMTDAVNSWIPAMCTQAGVDFGYVDTGDLQARDQYSQKDTSLIFTSSPVDDSGGGTSTLYAPAALAAVTIAVFSVNSSGQNLTNIKLNARLVAKLLTESYLQAVTGPSALPGTPWANKLPADLIDDPEFQALNPQASNGGLGSDLVVTVNGSDAASALWQWVSADPDAKAFLDGCPDAASKNSVINPFYSTRSYTECQSQAVSLEATAAIKRSAQSPTNPKGTVLPDTYVDSTPVYPPTVAAFPQPGYYQEPAVVDSKTGAIIQPPLTFADLHPRESTFTAIAADVFRGQEKSLTSWCAADIDCPGAGTIPAGGAYINGAGPKYGAGVVGLTDGSAAAKDLLPTALLCDDSGSNCVGANNGSLQKAANGFVASSISSHFLQAPATPDYAGGAYPLTLPVYAEINTNGLDQTDATAYAKVLSFISTTGQQQGFDIGNLPPGMAPLTDALVAQTDSAISTLQQITDPTSAAGGGGSSSPNTDQLPPVGFVPTDPGSGSPSPSPTPQAMAGPIAITPVSAVGFLPYGVGTGLLGALGAGIAAPIVGRKRRA